MRNQLLVHRSRRIGTVLTTAEMAVRVCCRAIVTSGFLETRKQGGIGEWIVRAGVSAKAPCERHRSG